MRAAFVRLSDDNVVAVFDPNRRPRIDTPGIVRIVWLPDATPEIETPTPLATLTAGLTQFDVGGEEAWAADIGGMESLIRLQEFEALKTGYLDVLGDIETIIDGADAAILVVEEIRTRTISTQAQAVTALRDLAAQVKLSIQGTRLGAVNARKTMKGLRRLV